MGQGSSWTKAQRDARLGKLRERNRNGHKGCHRYEDRTWMLSCYVGNGMSLREIAHEAGCGVRTVARWMQIHNIPTDPTRVPRRRTGPDHPHWKGGKPTCRICGGPCDQRGGRCTDCYDKSGESNPKWRGDAAEYTAVHYRLVTQRGRPTSHQCARCDNQGREWAYDHTDPNEQRNRQGRDDGPYSLDLNRYLPLCVPCHRLLDNSRRRST